MTTDDQQPDLSDLEGLDLGGLDLGGLLASAQEMMAGVQ